jgi:hypothetical protein
MILRISPGWGIVAMQRHTPDDANCPNAGLAIVPSLVDMLDHGTVEQKSGKVERVPPALSFVPFALGAIVITRCGDSAASPKGTPRPGARA